MERVRKKKSARPEDQIQRAIFAHLRTRGAPGIVAFHIPLGGYRRPMEAAIFRGLGVMAGLPDVFVIRPAVDGAFLRADVFAIELKSEAGKTSDVQRETLARLKAAGVHVAVTRGLDEAIRKIEEWGLVQGKAA